MNQTTDLLTADDLAARLRVRPGTVRLWGRRGLIPTVRISAKVIRYDVQAVLTALRERAAGERKAVV